MRLALLLFGLSKHSYEHWDMKKINTCDYKTSYDNYQEYIFNYFKQKGYQIDVYFSTNEMCA